MDKGMIMTAKEAASLADWLKINGISADDAIEYIKYIAARIQNQNDK